MIPTNSAEEWFLVKDDPKVIHEEVRDEEGTLLGYRKRNLFTVTIERFVFRVTSFQSSIDDTKSTFDVRTGPETRITVAYSGKKFYCVSAARDLVEVKTGKYKETQVWLHKSEGALQPPTYFTDGGGS